MKKGEVGINSLNQKLQNILNPKGKGKQEKQVGEEIFRVGDKVMQIKNNYRIEWKTAQGEEGEGIFNGDLGIIDDIDEEEKNLRYYLMMNERLNTILTRLMSLNLLMQ